jgi:AbrB family looped-hinge helix DNA binding protein
VASSLQISRVQRKGQVTIPQELRERHGIQEGDFVAFTETDAGILITPQKVIPTTLLEKAIGAREAVKEHLQSIKRQESKKP